MIYSQICMVFQIVLFLFAPKSVLFRDPTSRWIAFEVFYGYCTSSSWGGISNSWCLSSTKGKVSSWLSLFIVVAFFSFNPAKGGGDCSVSSSGFVVVDCFLTIDVFCDEKCNVSCLKYIPLMISVFLKIIAPVSTFSTMSQVLWLVGKSC